MSDIARWNIVAMSDAHGAYVSVDDHLADKQATRQAALEDAARVADYCASIAFTDHGRVTAAEVALRIRALMQEGTR